jgi:hypothetical protein
MDAVLLLTYFSALAVFFHGLTEVRTYMEATVPEKPWLVALDECNIAYFRRWGIMAVNAAQVGSSVCASSHS